MPTKVGAPKLKNESNFGQIALPKNSILIRFFIDSIFNFFKAWMAKFFRKTIQLSLILYFVPDFDCPGHCYA
jgi:hypothetical protein